MGNYRFILEEQKKLVVTMLDRGQTPADIENATGIKVRTVQRLRRLWLSSGRVIKATKRRTRTRLALEFGVECEGILRHLRHRLLNLGVCYKQRRTMKKNENVYRYENSCNGNNTNSGINLRIVGLT